jgi:hypothetical protein
LEAILTHIADGVTALPMAGHFDPVISFVPKVVAKIRAQLWRFLQEGVRSASLDEMEDAGERLVWK